jgi:uroporphyrin-III C-methyltransferase / precorrin-2 dehydrogenase / sirohydrochlorin ferrochelatase
VEQLPIFLNLRGQAVLLIGAGPAADAKRRLIEAAGGVVVAEPQASARIAFVTTDPPEADAARLNAMGLLVNVVDRPDLCDFTVPAIVNRAPVTVAIGTGGASATLAKALRERLEALLPGTLGQLAAGLFAARASIAARLPDAADRRRALDAALSPGGTLDPLAEMPGDIMAALGPASSPGQLVTIRLRSPDPDDLTLKELRALSRADRVHHAPGTAPAILDRARRDAVRIVVSAAPAAPASGLDIYLEG